MIAYEHAREIALTKIGPECGLIDSSIIEKPYGWYFMYQTKQYIETGDVIHSLIGSGGFIVEREDGRVYEFGSGYSLEDNFRKYEAGFKYESYDLTIHEVNNKEQTLDLLLKLQMRFVTLKEVRDTTKEVPELFSRSMIKERLQELPCSFRHQGFYFVTGVFEEIDNAVCCGYKIEEASTDFGLKAMGELITTSER